MSGVRYGEGRYLDIVGRYWFWWLGAEVGWFSNIR